MTIDLDKLKQQRARLEARLAATTTTLQEAQRKADTRRRIVLGGSTLTAIRDGVLPAWVLPTLVGRMAPRDAALFPEVTTPVAGESEGVVQ